MSGGKDEPSLSAKLRISLFTPMALTQMRRLTALVAALLLPAGPSLLLGTAVLSATLWVSQAPAQAQSAEAVGKVAQAITVRIEGATQGSGVLVKREGNRYTVLTAWHVVSGQRSGEELDIYTPDGQRHQFEQGSIKRLGEVDMAVLTFISSNSYELARVGDVMSVSSGEQVLVAGFPISSNGKLKYDRGKLVANAAVGIDQGYQLLYTNDTVSGMSGGVVLRADGTLIGMHGRGELDEARTRSAGRQIKTGTNQGVPISYYNLYTEGKAVVPSSAKASTTDDFLAQARALLGIKGSEQELIKLASSALASQQSAEAYFYRAFAYDDLGSEVNALKDLDRAIAINPRYGFALRNRGLIYEKQGNIAAACKDWRAAGELGVAEASFWNQRQCQ